MHALGAVFILQPIHIVGEGPGLHVLRRVGREADARERARRNLDFDPMALYDRMADMGSSPAENFRVLQARQAEMAGYQGGVMPVSLLNPLAWGQFINALRNGEYRKR